MTTGHTCITIDLIGLLNPVKVSRNTVYQLIYAGDIPTISIGRARRIRYAALHEWAERSERGAYPVPLTAEYRRRA